MRINFLTQSNQTALNTSVFLLRLIVGVSLFVVGAGKVLGLFGGFGPTVTLQYYANMGISWPLAYISMFTEFIGGFFLIIGLFTRPVAILIAINMLVASYFALPMGFLQGLAYPLTLLIVSISILLTGPMAYSIDWLFQSRPIGHIRNERKRYV